MKNLKIIAKNSFKNRNNVEKSQNCGCYYCQSIFPATNIKTWTDNGQTAECPICEIDSVIPDNLNYELNKELLQELNKEMF